ncbi:MAG: lysophospholipase [Desulfatirhabdiaceae bacterium]
MMHQDGFFQSANDTRIFYQNWLPESPSRGVLLLAHGLGEHSGRYMNLINHFVPMGYAVYGLDHVGHGKSDGTRKYADRFDDFIQPLKTYREMIQQWQPDKPVFLIGHSMGGLISAIYLLDHQNGLSGAVLSGPSVQVPENISASVIVIGKILSLLMPKFGLIETIPQYVSRDPKVVQAYLDDPLVYKGKTTARLASEMLGAMQRVSREAFRISLPILILQGGADRLVRPAGSRMLHDAVSSVDKKIKLYEGLYHEIYNESEYHVVLQDVAQWIEARLSSSQL